LKPSLENLRSGSRDEKNQKPITKGKKKIPG